MTRIIRMGLILYLYVPTNATMKIMQLMMNVYRSVLKLPKFSAFISSKEADASKPTTAGRSPLKTASTEGCFWYFKKNLLMSNIRMKEGNTTAKVAVHEPSMPIHCEYPALQIAV